MPLIPRRCAPEKPQEGLILRQRRERQIQNRRRFPRSSQGRWFVLTPAMAMALGGHTAMTLTCAHVQEIPSRWFDRTLRPLIPGAERRSELSSSGRNIPHRQRRRHSDRLVSIPDAASLRDALREKYAAYSGRIESMQLALVREQFVSSDFRFAVEELGKRQDVLVLDTLHPHRESQ